MFYFGVDYYPEHWPESRWPEDVRLMVEAGINVVRLAEFAWSKMEPEDGSYDFGWLDRVIALLAQHDIDVILGTPTASPPPWLMAKQEDLFLVSEYGVRLTYGNRREYCPNNALYHDYSRRIVEEMAGHFKENPAVIGWQIDNEFGSRCYCDICRGEFQRWLERRYGTLGNLNEQWGTVFWSHVYNDWSEVPVPRLTGSSPNPGLGLDYSRFMSDSYMAYQKIQVDILRRICPEEHFITHNFMGFKYNFLNYFDMAQDIDFVSWDIYWRMQWNMQAATDPCSAALGHDAMRGLKGKNHWVMEQQSGSGGWEHVSVSPRPGELRLWAYQSIAHGADGIVFFRWRTARYGTEQYWHGLLDHHGLPGRRYAEIKRMGEEVGKLANRISGALVKPEVAIISSYDSRFAFQLQGNNPRFDYPSHVQQIYRAFYDRQVPVDIVSPAAALSNYKIVVVPALHILTEEVAGNLKQYVASGGLLVVTPRTGVKDEANAVVNQVLPGLLAELCGVEVEEYVSLPVDVDSELEFTELAARPRVPAQVWCDLLRLNGATAIAHYTQDFFAGKPAMTMNNSGEGWVIYVGSFGDELYAHMADYLLDFAGMRSLLSVPEGVEVSERWQGERQLLFVLNQTEQEQVIALDRPYQDLLCDRQVKGDVPLGPLDILILA
jgi:beta-galactosidase